MLHELQVIGSPSEEDIAFVSSDKARRYLRSLPPCPRADFRKLYPHADEQVERSIAYAAAQHAVDSALAMTGIVSMMLMSQLETAGTDCAVHCIMCVPAGAGVAVVHAGSTALFLLHCMYFAVPTASFTFASAGPAVAHAGVPPPIPMQALLNASKLRC